MTIKPKPRPVANVDIIREKAIKEMAARAQEDGAIVAAMIYETADKQIRMICYPDAESLGDGLIRKVCEMKGIEI